jgi:hypothetical protein
MWQAGLVEVTESTSFWEQLIWDELVNLEFHAGQHDRAELWLGQGCSWRELHLDCSAGYAEVVIAWH